MMKSRTKNALAVGLTTALLIGSSLSSGLGNTNVAPAPTIRAQKDASAKLFLRMAEVIESPRCLNCHPAGRSPTQGDDMHLHTPPMVSDASGHGIPGLHCSACHSASNEPIMMPNIKIVPGNPAWSLAPAAFAWQHRSLREICEQIKDPRRNGGRTLEKIHDHVAYDPLVGWAWHPGLGRKPAPMTQATFGKLVQHWINSGAECPAG
jgi:hypothetical protein